MSDGRKVSRGRKGRNSPLWRGERRFNPHGVPEPTKEELKGELIAFSVRRYEPNYLTQFGVKPKTVASLFVLTGPLSGEYFKEWTVVGPMAAQMGKCPPGAMIGARVVSRLSGSGYEYLTVDLDIIESDQQALRECLRWGFNGRRIK